MAKHTIAVLGAGNVGGALAPVWSAAGHNIILACPTRKAKNLARRFQK